MFILKDKGFMYFTVASVIIIHQEKMPNIYWFQFIKSDNLLPFFALYNYKFNNLGFEANKKSFKKFKSGT